MVILLFIFLITFVVPRFAELYEQLGTKLPALTLFLLALEQRRYPELRDLLRRRCWRC